MEKELDTKSEKTNKPNIQEFGFKSIEDMNLDPLTIINASERLLNTAVNNPITIARIDTSGNISFDELRFFGPNEDNPSTYVTQNIRTREIKRFSKDTFIKLFLLAEFAKEKYKPSSERHSMIKDSTTYGKIIDELVQKYENKTKDNDTKSRDPNEEDLNKIFEIFEDFFNRRFNR